MKCGTHCSGIQRSKEPLSGLVCQLASWAGVPHAFIHGAGQIRDPFGHGISHENELLGVGFFQLLGTEQSDRQGF